MDQSLFWEASSRSASQEVPRLFRNPEVTWSHSGPHEFSPLPSHSKAQHFLLPASCWFRVWFTLCPWRYKRYIPIYSSETSVDFHWTTGRYIPEDRAFHSHRCESLNTVFALCNSFRSPVTSCLLGSDRFVLYWWMMNRKKFGRKRWWTNRGTILEFSWRAWEKQRRTTVAGAWLRFEPSNLWIQI
jgi:hypothetical protein